jgi:hypothetical protein
MTRGAERRRPLYARVLRLRHIRPGGLSCFLMFEGVLALGVLLALAELVNWWAVPVLPVVVAGAVKFNDLVIGVLRAPGPTPPVVRRTATVPVAAPASGGYQARAAASGRAPAPVAVRPGAMRPATAPVLTEQARDTDPYRPHRRGGGANQRRFDRPA